MCKKIKENFGLFLLLLLLLIVIGSLFLIGMFANSNFALDEITEKTITSKYSESGLYFGPTYYVVSDDGIPSRIFGKKKHDLQIGDKYTVRNGLTNSDLLIIVLAILIVVPFFIWTICFLFVEIFDNTKPVRWLVDKKTNLTNRYDQLGKLIKRFVVILFVCISIVCLILIGKNTFHKIIPFGKTTTMAEIIDQEKEFLFSPKIITTTYTLTLQYVDNMGEIRKTKKDVSHLTFDKFKNEDYISIAYRNNRPYDTFINTQSFKVYMSGIFRFESIVIIIVIYLNYFIIRKYYESWCNKRNRINNLTKALR